MFDSKSSSVKTRSEAYLEALQPDPIARPIFAIERHPTSEIPSPVTATALFLNLNPLIRISLSSGVALANTLSSPITLSNSAIF